MVMEVSLIKFNVVAVVAVATEVVKIMATVVKNMILVAAVKTDVEKGWLQLWWGRWWCRRWPRE